MKKLFNLLLFLPFFLTAQGTPTGTTSAGKFKAYTATKDNTATRVVVQDSITKEYRWVLKSSLTGGGGAVTSVNGQTGAVVLTSQDVFNEDNTLTDVDVELRNTFDSDYKIDISSQKVDIYNSSTGLHSKIESDSIITPKLKITNTETTALPTPYILVQSADGTVEKLDWEDLPTATTPDATTTVKGKLKLAGDLGGTADAPTVPNKVDKTTEVNGQPLSGDVNLGLQEVLLQGYQSDQDIQLIDGAGIYVDANVSGRNIVIKNPANDKYVNISAAGISDSRNRTEPDKDGTYALLDDINKPIKTIDLTSSDYTLIDTDLDRYLFIQSGGIGSIFLPTDGTFENGDVIQIFNNDGATAIDPAPNSTVLIGSDLILSLHTAYLKYNVDATLGNFWTVSYMTDGDNNTVDSVNGQTGTVVIDADDVSDTSTTNKFTNATEKGTWNGKQDALSGTGFVKIAGTTISYDNSTYLTTSSASSTYAPISSPTFTGTATTPALIVSGATASTIAEFDGSKNLISATKNSAYNKSFGTGTTNIPEIGATLTASKVLVTDVSGKLAVSSVTPTTLGYLDATSSVQTQINTKVSASSTDTFTNKTLSGATNTFSNIPLTALSGYYNYKNSTASSTVTGTTSETQVLQLTIPANTFSATDVLKMPILMISKTGTAGNLIIRVKLTTSNTMPSGSTSQIATYQAGATMLFANVNRSFSIGGGNIYGYPNTTSAVDSSASSTIALSSQAFDPTVVNYLYISLTLGNSGDSAFLQGVNITN